MRSFQLKILGVDVSFRASAETEDVDQAKKFLEESARKLKSGGGQHSRETLLALLALGTAYDLLQTQQKLETARKRLSALLKSIDESV